MKKKNLKKLKLGLDGSIVINYKKNLNDPLANLCDTYGSDKGSLKGSSNSFEWLPHTYTELYTRLFSKSRESIKLVFECGIGTNNPRLPSSMGINGKPGASLLVWRDYFPNARIFGGDIDKTILFQRERIETFYIDQTNQVDIENYWKVCGVKDFDIMIDDGLHTFEAGSTLFTHSIGMLSKSGVYIIEDVRIEDLLTYQKFFRDTEYNVEFINLFHNGLNLDSNNIVLIRKPCN